MNLNKLAKIFEIKIAQQLIPENKTLIRNYFISLVDNKFHWIRRPDKVVISLLPTNSMNTLSLSFVFGQEIVSRLDLGVAADIEDQLNAIINNDKNLKVLLDKSFDPKRFGQPIEIKGSELTLTPPHERSVRTKL